MKCSEIYIVHVDDKLGFYKPGRCPAWGVADPDKFIDWAKGLREQYPEHKLRCVINEGIENFIRKRYLNQKLIHNNIEKLKTNVKIS